MGDNGEEIYHVCTNCNNRVTYKPPKGAVQVLVPPKKAEESQYAVAETSKYGPAAPSDQPIQAPNMKYERQVPEAGH